MAGPIGIVDPVHHEPERCAGELFYNLCDLTKGHTGNHSARAQDGMDAVSWSADMWGDG